MIDLDKPLFILAAFDVAGHLVLSASNDLDETRRAASLAEASRALIAMPLRGHGKVDFAAPRESLIASIAAGMGRGLDTLPGVQVFNVSGDQVTFSAAGRVLRLKVEEVTQ